MPTADNPVKKHPGGRPSKYTPELLRKAEEYLTKWESYGNKIPSVASLAKVLELPRERLHVWSNDKNKSEFRNIIKRLLTLQESKLLDNGLDGTFNSAITKLVLSKHGYQDNPVNNQGPAGITVQVNRGSVVLKTEGQTLEIAEQTPGTTLEHQPD